MSVHPEIFITKAKTFHHKKKLFLFVHMKRHWARLLSVSLCSSSEDEGLTFLPWLAEGQYYKRRRQSCPILKQWGLIFLKSLAIVFDKSIWEAFRERIRDVLWPTFPLLFFPWHHRYWTGVLIRRASKTGTATFGIISPLSTRLGYRHCCHLSDPYSSLKLSFSPSVCKIFPPLHLLSPAQPPHPSVYAYQTEPMLNDSVGAGVHSGRASWCLDLAKGVAWNVQWRKMVDAPDISQSQFLRCCSVPLHYSTDHRREKCGKFTLKDGKDCVGGGGNK